MRGATRAALSSPTQLRNFNPRTPCGVRRDCLRPLAADLDISIHAPRAGCDFVSPCIRRKARDISIHAPRAGCDALRRFCHTRPLQHFNPRTPCGVRPLCAVIEPPLTNFNPRTPCGVRPPPALAHKQRPRNFNPRTPCGVRPHMRRRNARERKISIHAPRAGCDRSKEDCTDNKERFQSTHPVRGATAGVINNIAVTVEISIHAPRAGCDISR